MKVHPFLEIDDRSSRLRLGSACWCQPFGTRVRSLTPIWPAMDLDCSKAIRPSLHGEWVPSLAGTFCGTPVALTDLVFSVDAGTNSSIWHESISSA